MWTIPDLEEIHKPLDEAIDKSFIPANRIHIKAEFPTMKGAVYAEFI